MKKDILKIASIDLAALLLYCIIGKYGENFIKLFAGHSIGLMSAAKFICEVANILIIPICYVAVNKITGRENDFLILWNMPLMAVLSALVCYCLPWIVPTTPFYLGIFVFAASYVLSHALIRLSN